MEGSQEAAKQIMIYLMELRLYNFKGVGEFVFSPGGRDAIIRGDNATGKTTILDAWLWLLFGKDSRGKADFEIKTLKTLDASGEPYRGLEHTVEAVLQTADRTIELAKVYREVWKKKRGSNVKHFSGHETRRYIDQVPVKQKDWDARIGELIKEETFRLLTDPHYVAGLRWDRRRELIMSACGSVKFHEVVENNNELSRLPEILGQRTLEDYRQVVKGRQKEINKRLGEIPPRIDELQKSDPAEEYTREWLDNKINEVQASIDSLRASGGKSKLLREYSELQRELADLEAKARKEYDEAAGTSRDGLQQLKDQRAEKSRELRDVSFNLSQKEKDLQQLNERVNELRSQYHAVANNKPEPDQTCPTCGQQLPQEQIQEVYERRNREQAERLREINREGKEKKQAVEGLQGEIEQLRMRSDKLDQEIASLDQQIEKQELEVVPFEEWKSSWSERIQDGRKRLEEINKELEQADSSGQERLDELQGELEKWQTERANLQARERSAARIGELQEEEKKLSQEYERLEQEIYLMERFDVEKATLLEERINSQFGLVRFRMFHENLNGGIEEDCEITVEGVPYGSLNSAKRINAGLDIIRTLAGHYGVHVPVFADHIESVTNLLHPGMQMVKLIVDLNYPELEVEHG